jgi:formiminotetrahydrofolate cyclodeaminase
MSDPADMLKQPITEFVAATASKNPTPGGGSVAGLVGALAAALGEMSLNFTRGKKAHSQHEDLYATLGPRLTHAREMFLQLIADDMAAYGMYAAAMKQPQDQRGEALQLALAAAIDVPRQTAKLALAVLGDLSKLADKCNKFLVTDLVGAATLAAAVTVLCDMNVKINTRDLDDTQAATDIRQASTADRQRARELAEVIESTATAWLNE